jgi:hypothetical protein
MKMTKKYSTTYDIEFYGSFQMPWKNFRETRERHGLNISKFDHCFICNHQFADDEIPQIITVSSKGNRFACGNCATKEGEAK